MKKRNQSINSISKNYSNIITFILLISLNIFMTSSENNNYVYFPLKRKDDTYLNNLKNITEMMKFIYLEPLVSELTLGTPEQKSNVIFRTDCTYIYLTSFNHNISHPDQVKDFIQSKYGNFKYFNEDNSNSINYIEKNYSHLTYEYYNQYFTRCVSENVKINNNNIRLDLMLSKSIKYEEPGAICLQLSEEENTVLQYTASFPVLLKRNYSLINNYKWFIYYGQKNENDYLVLGTSVKEFINPDSRKNLYPNKIIGNYDNTDDSLEVRKAGMTMKFDDIYLVSYSNDIEIFEDKNNFKGKLIPNIGFVVGTTNYSQYLEANIFGNYIKLDKCHKSIFSQRPNLVGEEYSFFYCDESLYNEIKSKFKKIVFKQTNLYEYFELTFDDLFMKKNGYLIFLVIFSTHMHNNWDFGTPFLKKYQFDYDFENLKIGYYHLLAKNEKHNNSNFMKYIKYSFIIVILSVILVYLGILLGRNYFTMRKKRANELDDDFEYDSKKENEKEKNSPIID